MNSPYNIHILAFGPHPDDVEIGAGGLLYKSSQSGRDSMIIDLTCSHLSIRGNPDQRLQESQDAAKILGVKRLNLGLDDLSIVADHQHRDIIAGYIRKYRPEIVVFPYHHDRHPDHEATSKIVQDALFAAGLLKLDIQGLAPHRPRIAAMYQIWDDCRTDVIVSLSDPEYMVKHQSFWSYGSQQETNYWAKEYFDARAKVLGWKIGSHYGEGYVLYESHVGLDSLDNLQARAL